MVAKTEFMRSPTNATYDIPVLIVGGGPIGLLNACLLAGLGVESLIIERHSTRMTAPKAHAVGPRSLDVLRQADFDISELRKRGSDREESRWVNFVTSLSGETLGRLPYERMDSDVLDVTPEMFHNVPQPEVESMMAQKLKGKVEIRKSHSFESCTQDETGVCTVVENRITKERYEIRSQYVIACDGARSKLRQCLGIECDGELSETSLMTIEISADLRPLVKSNPGILYWLINPEAHGSIIGYDLSSKQVMMCNFDPNEHPLESWDEALCRRTVDAAMGKNKVPYQVKSFRPWLMKRQVAKHYQVGRAFLSGDAAHSFPPSAGIGLNSGIGDAHNLCWKLAGVLKGWAPESFLSTYHEERRPIAEINSQQSIKNGQKIYGLAKRLGKSSADVKTAWENLSLALKDPVQRSVIAQQIQERAENFDNLELHIGYVYGSKETPRDASDYRPKYIPGARLPHLWIKALNSTIFAGVRPVDLFHVHEFSAAAKGQRQFSTLDLCRYDSFTLILNSSQRQKQRAVELRDILAKSTTTDSRVSVPLRIVHLGEDFEVVFPDLANPWIDHLRLNQGENGGVLVRPDQHILCLLRDASTAQDIASELHGYLYQERS